MSHSNKDKRSSAESEEGRPLIKENAGQPNTYPTQSGKGVSQGLAGVRKAARENKEMKFTALLHHLTVDLLRESFYSLKRKAAPGVDGVTWQEYEAGLEDRLIDLHGRVHRGAYRALPSRRVYIQKEDGPEDSFAILDRIDDSLVRVLVIVVAVTAMRIGEALGLVWSDLDWKKLKINVRRDWVDGELGRPKSRVSKAPVEMHETLAALLREWRQETPYSKDSDFLFPSFKLHGKQPRLGSMIVQDYIRPAAIAAGVIAPDCPRFGFHNLRHGLSTFLVENGHDPAVVQRMHRQSHVDMTMHYVHNSHKARDAQAQFIERFLPNSGTVTDVEEQPDKERVPVRVQ